MSINGNDWAIQSDIKNWASVVGSVSGHGFSRAVSGPLITAALAADQGLKPHRHGRWAAARLKPRPDTPRGGTLGALHRTKGYVLILCVLASAALANAPRARAARIMIDRIIARVNEKIITQRQYDLRKEQLRAQLAQQYSGAELEAQYQAQEKDLLRGMIDQDLLVQKAQDLNINVDTQVVQRLDQIRKQMGVATIPDLEKVVEKEGLIWEDFQNNVRRELLVREVIGREVGSRINVSTSEAKKYFEAHKKEFGSPAGVELAEVQVSNQKWGPAVADKRAKAALAMVQSGAKWEDVVKKYSDGPGLDKGGDVGFFPKGSLLPGISKAIQNLDPGDTSAIIPVTTGYMILRVLQLRSPGAPQFQEVADQVENIVYEQKMQPALHQYLSTLRCESYIYKAPGFIDTGAPASCTGSTADEGE
jgi:peptidyl-prolyl cis-trans isomerase SurA